MQSNIKLMLCIDEDKTNWFTIPSVSMSHHIIKNVEHSRYKELS